MFDSDSDIINTFSISADSIYDYIAENIIGNSILLVDLSDGTFEVQLAKKGIKTLSVYSSSSQLETVKKFVSESAAEELRGYVDIKSNEQTLFIDKNSFDTIVINPFFYKEFNASHFNKYKALLKQEGKIIVVSLFGLFATEKQKSIKYFNSFIELQNNDICISKIEFINHYMVIEYKFTNNPQLFYLDKQFLSKLEEAFYRKEYYLYSKILSLKKNVEYKSKYLNEKISKIKFEGELLQKYKDEKKILVEMKQLNKDYDILMKKYKSLERKYYNLRNSKLGKLTMLYWKLRGSRG